MLKTPRNAQLQTNRSVGITLGIAIGLIVVWLTTQNGTTPIWLTSIGFTLIFLAIIKPATLTPVSWFWLGLGKVLHNTVSPIILSLIYLIAVVPTGVYLKLSRKDPLRLKFQPNAKTYWIKRDESTIETESLKNQF